MRLHFARILRDQILEHPAAKPHAVAELHLLKRGFEELLVNRLLNFSARFAARQRPYGHRQATANQ